MGKETEPCRANLPESRELLNATIRTGRYSILGVKPGQRVAALGIDDAAFLKELAGRVPDFVREKTFRDGDIVFLGADDLKALSRVKSLVGAIQKSGAIWIVYPKGQSHIREADVMAAGKVAGLTDNKVCRFSETHTALRFVIPLARR